MFDHLLKEALGADSEQARIDAALQLARLRDELEEALDEVKDRLRFAALSQLNGAAGSVALHGTDGQVSVNIPRPTLKVVGDRESLRKGLGESYELFFEERVTVHVRPEFRFLVQGEEPSRRDFLFGAVSEVQGIPRVSFKVK